MWEIENLKIFPVPAESMISVESSQSDLIYELSNSLGSILKSGRLTGIVNISILDRPQGIYYLKISEGEYFTIKKIIKN